MSLRNVRWLIEKNLYCHCKTDACYIMWCICTSALYLPLFPENKTRFYDLWCDARVGQFEWIYFLLHKSFIHYKSVLAISTLCTKCCSALLYSVGYAKRTILYKTKNLLVKCKHFGKLEWKLDKHYSVFLGFILLAIFWYQDGADFQFCDWRFFINCRWKYMKPKNFSLWRERTIQKLYSVPFILEHWCS